MRRFLAFLAVLCLLPVGMADGGGGDHVHAEFEERVLAGALGPMDLHGTRLAWAAVRDGIVELKVTDLADGSETVVTRIAAEGRQPIQSLAFDGRWVAWTDGRYGNLDAFAVDTETGQMLRLSEHSQDDRDIDVEDGRFAWVREGIVLADDSGAAQIITGSGAAFEPSFARGWLVWSQIQDQRRVIRGQYLADGTLHTLADNEGIIHKNLDASGDYVVWGGTVDSQARLYARALHSDGTAGDVRVLTDWGVFGPPRIGGGYAAWIEPHTAMLYVERLADGRASTMHADMDFLLSDDLLVLTTGDSAGVRITPIRLEEWETRLPIEVRDPRPYLVVAGMVVLLGGAGLRWWQARRKAS